MNSINLDETMVLDTDLISVSIIEKLIDSQAQMLGLDDEIYGKYMLSAVECVNNAIVHGNENDHNKHITVTYHITNERIEFSVTDEGPGFDPNSLPDPTAEENLERDCGRGVFLMRHLCDSLEFENGGRTVKMAFNLK